MEHLDLIPGGIREDSLYFGESQSRVILSAASDRKEEIILIAQNHRVPIYQVGRVGGEEFVMGDKIKLAVKEIAAIYQNAIPKGMEK